MKRSLRGAWQPLLLPFLAAVFACAGASYAETASRATTGAAMVTIVPDTVADADGDGLLDEAEIGLGTDPYEADTDGDGIPDNWEVINGLDPLDATDVEDDADGDGLSNFEEFFVRSLPFLEDTDGDGFWDGLEVDRGSDPCSAFSAPVKAHPADVDANGIVNAVDLQLVISGAMGLSTPAPTDVDGTGAVNAIDVQLAVNAVLGLY